MKSAQTLIPNQSGDACRHPVQSPDVVGQGGTLTTCRHRLNRPELGACPYCQPQESVNLGQGGTND